MHICTVIILNRISHSSTSMLPSKEPEDSDVGGISVDAADAGDPFISACGQECEVHDGYCIEGSS